MSHIVVYRRRIALYLCTIFGMTIFFSACMGNTLPAPVATVPSSIPPQTIYAPIQPQMIVNDAMTTNYTWSRVNASYNEQLNGLYSSFYIPLEKSFIGQLEIGNMLATAHQYAIICLVDYQQMPCNPQLQPVQIESMKANSTAKISLQLPIHTAGMHDLEIVITSDPYQQVSQAELHTLTDVMNMPTMANIYVGDTANSPLIHTVNPQPQPTLTAIGNPEFIANQVAGLADLKGIPVWLQEETHVGEEFDFYLHFHNQQGWQRTNAVMAFVNYIQSPIYVNGATHLPLYVARQPGTWQSIHATIQAPTEPGEYDLLLVNRTHAHQRLEGVFAQMTFLFDQPFTQVQLIKLKVIP